MAGVNSTVDIKRAALRNAGELSDGTSAYDEHMLGWIKDAYLKILGDANPFDVDVSDPWHFARSPTPGVIILKAPYETGTVSLTNGSASGTFNTAPGVGLGSLAGRVLKIADRPEFFRILTHTAGAGPFTLDAVYTDETGSALGFKAIRLDYDIGTSQARILRLVNAMNVYRRQAGAAKDGKISGLDLAVFQENHPLIRLEGGVPSAYAVVVEANGVITVRFNKYVSQDTRVEYEWIPVPTELEDSDASIPIIPLNHRCVLEYAATWRLMLEKEDQRKNEYLALTKGQIQAMQAGKRAVDSTTSSNYGKLVARPDQVGQRKTDFDFGN
jgi:hypothetical protein